MKVETGVVAASIILFSLIAFSSGAAGQPSDGKIEVVPNQTELDPGESKKIAIQYQAPSSVDPTGLEFDLDYDPDVITVTDATKTEFLSQFLSKAEIKSGGTVEIGGVQSNPTSKDSGKFATITVELTGGVNKGDTTDIEINNVITTTSDDAPDAPSPKIVSGTVEAAAATELDFDPKFDTPSVPNTIVQNRSYKPTVKVTNEGSNAGVATVNYTLENPAGKETNISISKKTSELQPDESQKVSYNISGNETANITVYEQGNYVHNFSSQEGGSKNVNVDVVKPATITPTINTSNLENGVVSGEEINIQVKVRNDGGIKNSSTVGIYINQTLNDTIETDEISPDGSEIITFDYTPTEADGPALNITVNTSDGTDKEIIDILTPGNAKLNITEVTSPIEGEGLDAAVKITNIGDTVLSETLNISIPDIGENSTEISLKPGNHTVERVTIPTTVGDNGTYTLNASTPSNSTEQTVVIGKVGTIDIEIADAPASISAGEKFSVTANITNTGDEKIDREIIFRDNATESPFNTTNLRLNGGEKVQLVTERETTLDEPESVLVTVSANKEKATEIITIKPPEPPEITSITINKEQTNDEAVVTTRFRQGSLNVSNVTTTLQANFTSFSKSQLNSSSIIADGGVVKETFSVKNLSSDGNYTTKVVIENEAGQTVNETGDVVEVDTTPPALQLDITNLSTDKDANLSISAEGKFSITSIVARDGDGNEISTKVPSGLRTAATVSLDDSSTLNVTVRAEDKVGNPTNETLFATVSEYEIKNDEAEVKVNDYTQLNLNLSEGVNESKEPEITTTISESPPEGTVVADDQLIGGVVDVADIGLADDKLEQAEIRLAVDEIPKKIRNEFDTGELRIMRSEDGETTYHPVSETTYNKTTNELVATVDSFSQHGAGGVDNTPPSIDSVSTSPDTNIKADDESVTTIFEYSSTGTAINTSETTIKIETVDDDRYDVDITPDSAKVTVSHLKSGESFDIKLTVADNAGNKNTDVVSINVGESEDDSNNNDNKDGGSGGSSGGAGGGGGVSSGSSSTGDGPPTFDEIRSTLALVSPDSKSTVQIGSSTKSEPTVRPTETNTVTEIVFNNDRVSGKVSISEYSQIPQAVEKDTKASISAALSDVSRDDLHLISLAEIESTIPPTEDSSATVRFELDPSRVDDIEALTVIKETYVFEQQKRIWKKKPTTVTESDGSIKVETEVDSFSLVTLAEIESGETVAQSDSDSDSDTHQKQGGPEFEVDGLVALFAVTLGIISTIVVAHQHDIEFSTLYSTGETSSNNHEETGGKHNQEQTNDSNTQTASDCNPETTVKHYFSALEEGNIDGVNSNVHPEAKNEEVSEEEAAKLREKEFKFEVTVTDVFRKSDSKAVVEGTVQSATQSNSDADKFVFTLKQDGRWKIYDTG